MASIRNFVPGSGYGNAYIDSLIWGGTAWDLDSGPVRVWLGESVDFDQAVGVHGSSDHLRDAGAAYAWTQEEADTLSYAFGLYEAVCGLTLARIVPSWVVYSTR